MLERIIESSKKLIKKGKNAFCIGLASLTLLHASGCGRTMKHYVPIGRYQETLKEREYQEDEITYKIVELEVINSSILSILLTQSGTTATYKEKEIIIKEKLVEGGITTSTSNTITEIKDSSTITELINILPIQEGPAEIYILIKSENIKFKRLSEAKDILPQERIMVYSNKGTAKVKILEDILEFEFKKEDLIDQIKTWREIKEIKEPTRSKLLPLILNYIENKEYQIHIETIDQSTELKEVTNDKKTISVSGYKLPTEKIYLVLEDFINQEINSKIKEARIRLIDESTHTPVKNATLEIETKAPTKQELAKQYFEDSLLEWSTSKIKDYITGQETMNYDDNGEAVLPVYTLNNYSTESTHSKYAFAKVNLDFNDPKKLKQTIEMSQDPQKIRIIDK